MNEPKKETSKPDWEALITAQEESDLTQQAFCKQHDIVLTSFVYHRGRIKKKNKNAKQSKFPFSSVRVSKKEEIATGDIRLSLPNGFQCAFSAQLEAVQIKRLMEVLLSC